MSIKFAAWLLSTFLLGTFLSLPSSAQQTPPPANPTPADPQTDTPAKPTASGQGAQTSASPQSPADKDKAKSGHSTNAQGSNAGTSNDRLFLALPNFLTLENAGNVPPLTTAQKFKVVARGSFDKIEFPWYGILSAISQAENSEPGYGQGWEGYGKRYASAFGDGTIENFMTSAVFPSLLHQDPRFFQKSDGGFARRAEYAASRIFVTRTDSGHRQFNYSEIFGSAVSATISTNTYHPRAFITTRFDPTTDTLTYVHNASSRTLPNTASVWGTQVLYDTITILIKEFWPDVHHKMDNKRNGNAAQAGSPNP
ncbi:MAG: hypothetical protein ABSF72_06050 [Candidatus Sulfotelmatobacter sp.]